MTYFQTYRSGTVHLSGSYGVADQLVFLVFLCLIHRYIMFHKLKQSKKIKKKNFLGLVLGCKKNYTSYQLGGVVPYTCPMYLTLYFTHYLYHHRQALLVFPFYKWSLELVAK